MLISSSACSMGTPSRTWFCARRNSARAGSPASSTIVSSACANERPARSALAQTLSSSGSCASNARARRFARKRSTATGSRPPTSEQRHCERAAAPSPGRTVPAARTSRRSPSRSAPVGALLPARSASRCSRSTAGSCPAVAPAPRTRLSRAGPCTLRRLLGQLRRVGRQPGASACGRPLGRRISGSGQIARTAANAQHDHDPGAEAAPDRALALRTRRGQRDVRRRRAVHADTRDRAGWTVGQCHVDRVARSTAGPGQLSPRSAPGR